MIDAAELYRTLLEAHGEPGWWSDDPFTVMVQSVLVQNTSWPSVVRVSSAMGRISPEDVLSMGQGELEEAIRPCGFQRSKARTIAALAQWHLEHDDVSSVATDDLRGDLMSVRGVGRETADVILVYAFRRPAWIVDAYLRRLAGRLGLDGDDDAIRQYLSETLPFDAGTCGALHRLVLDHCMSVCRRKPACDGCSIVGCSLQNNRI